jgi:plasmid stability protein
MNITIRNLDASVFRKFKARAVQEGMKLGEAVAQAMDMWTKRGTAKQRGRLLEIEPFDWGEGTQKVSVEIDQILYGRKP